MRVFDRGRARESGVETSLRHAIAGLGPLLGDGSHVVELVRFDAESGIAVLRVEGDCRDCEMSAANMIEGIAAHLRARVPEVKDVQRMASLNQR